VDQLALKDQEVFQVKLEVRELLANLGQKAIKVNLAPLAQAAPREIEAQ